MDTKFQKNAGQALALIKWSNLSRIGKSNITRFLAIAPIFSVFFWATDHFVEQIEGISDLTSRIYFAYLGMCLVGVSSIIYRLACPLIILQHKSHLEYIGLHDLIVRERFNQIAAYIAGAERERVLACADERFIPRGFFRATTGNWTKDSQPEPEDVRRHLLYNYLLQDHSHPVTRVLVSLCFALGAVLIAAPSLQSMVNILGRGLGIESN